MTGMNPLSAKKGKVSQTTIEKIIHKDLHGILRKKYKVHALSNRQIQQRLERAPIFLGYLKAKRYKKVITVDECWIFLTYMNGVRRIYYEFKGRRTEESWTKFWKERHPKGVMCFMGVSYWGKTKLCFSMKTAALILVFAGTTCKRDFPNQQIPIATRTSSGQFLRGILRILSGTITRRPLW